MINYLVLLPCLLLVADASRGCQRLLQCQNEIENFEESSSLVGYVNEAEVLDAVCGELSQLTTCIDQNKNSCHDDTVKNEALMVKDIVEYMCTPAGRQLVMSLAESDCGNNPLVESHFDNIMQSCLETFQFNVQMEALDMAFSGREPQPSDFCPFIDQLKTCLVSGSRDLCGSQMGVFISNIWDICARNQFAEFGCTAGVVKKRFAIKRAVPMILKRTASLKKLRK